MAKTVTLSTDSRGIARITIARPERKNAFDDVVGSRFVGRV